MTAIPPMRSHRGPPLVEPCLIEVHEGFISRLIAMRTNPAADSTLAAFNIGYVSFELCDDALFAG
jgi:hypothetical protein